jgi:collagenase-like PrtC family protease
MNDVLDLTRPELVCPAGTPAALRTAVDAGADAVYCGLQNETNARNFPGLNFTVGEVEQSLAYAHARNAKVLLAVNTFPPAGKFQIWKDAIDAAARVKVDAVIVADIGVADYAARTYPDLRLHLSVQAPPHPRRSAFIASRSASSAWCCRACSLSPKLPSCTARFRARSRLSSSAISA